MKPKTGQYATNEDRFGLGIYIVFYKIPNASDRNFVMWINMGKIIYQ